MNVTAISGRLTADPDGKTVAIGGKNVTVCNFSLAVPRKVKKGNGDHPETDFIDFVAWGNQADFIIKFGKKGTKFEVVGSLEVDNYTDKDGNKRKATKIRVTDVSFGESKRDNDPGVRTSKATAAANDDDDLPY